MLDLVRKNAPQHMAKPEFQNDMLDSIDHALKRMTKVQARLSALKGEVMPEFESVAIGDLLRSCLDRLANKIPDLNIDLECPPELSLETDPDFIDQIMENLLINAREVGGGGTVVRIKVVGGSMLRIDVRDNGPGIQAGLLPNALFEPFKSGKVNGSGIGLWQVRKLVEILGGNIRAENGMEGGAVFTIGLPCRDGTGGDTRDGIGIADAGN
jgi:signal transduction histidine kinase